MSGVQPLLDFLWIEPQPRTRTAAEAHGAEPVGVFVDPTMQVSFRFTPLNGSQWSIDDVYVDSYRTN